MLFGLVQTKIGLVWERTLNEIRRCSYSGSRSRWSGSRTRGRRSVWWGRRQGTRTRPNSAPHSPPSLSLAPRPGPPRYTCTLAFGSLCCTELLEPKHCDSWAWEFGSNNFQISRKILLLSSTDQPGDNNLSSLLTEIDRNWLKFTKTY